MGSPDNQINTRAQEAALSNRPTPADHANPHQPEHDGDDHEQGHALEWRDVGRIAVVAVATAAVGFRVWEPLQGMSILGVLGCSSAGGPS